MNNLYDQIKQLIIGGEYKPGEKINQQEIATLFNVSRTPVTNCMHKLESVGLVDSVPNAGFYTHKLSLKELYDIFLMREMLEIAALRLWTKEKGDECAETIKERFKNHFESRELSLQVFREMDRDFHGYFIDGIDNALLKKINSDYEILSRTYIAGPLRDYSLSIDEHRALIESIYSKNFEEAIAIQEKHLSSTRKAIGDTITRLKTMGINPETVHIDEVSIA